MSNFSENQVDMAAALKAFECTLLGERVVTFSIQASVNDLAQLAFFLGIALEEKICADEELTEVASALRTQLIEGVQKSVPAFNTVDFDNLEQFKKSSLVGTEAVNDPIIINAFDELITRFEEVQRRLGS